MKIRDKEPEMHRSAGVPLFVAALAIALSACANHRAEGQLASYRATVGGEEAAVVRNTGPWFVWPGQNQLYAHLERIDRAPSATRGRSHEVDPGERVLTVGGRYCCRAWRMLDIGEVDLETTLLAGHVYLVRNTFGDGVMTFWIEDELTHQLVSERRSTKTTQVKNRNVGIPAVMFGGFLR